MQIEAYQTVLSNLESERIKALRDRQAFTFAGALSAGLGLLALFALVTNPSFLFAIMFVFLAFGAVMAFSASVTSDGDYQRKFNSLFTRNWIHDAFPEIYFTHASQAPVALEPQILGIMNSVLRRSPNQFRGVETLMFDKDPHDTTVFVLEKRGPRGITLRKRSVIVWFMPLTWDRIGLVRITKSPLSRPVVEESGATDSALAGKMLAVHAEISKVVGKRAVTVARTEAGLWLVVDDVKTPFKAPVADSCFDVQAYKPWIADARLPFSTEVRAALASLR
jgi:hypothetical protein